MVPNIEGKLAELNLAVVNRTEPLLYALQLSQLFAEAGIKTSTILLPRDSDQSGVWMWIADDDGETVSKVLWEKARIGGGSMRGPRPLGLEGLIPPKLNCLVIGEHDGALQPGNGQPGEGSDEHGQPVPAPQ